MSERGAAWEQTGRLAVARAVGQTAPPGATTARRADGPRRRRPGLGRRRVSVTAATTATSSLVAALSPARTGARVAAVLGALAAVGAAAASPSFAQGTLKVQVIDAVTRQPVVNATVFLDDPTGAEFRKTGFTQLDGAVTFPDLSAHDWTATAVKAGLVTVNGESARFRPGKVTGVVRDGETTTVEVRLERRPPDVLTLINQRLLIDPRDTALTTRRDLDFYRRFPVVVGDRESVPLALKAVPGFVYDGARQIHARGEQNGLATYIDGFHLPPFLEGRLLNSVPLQIAQTVDPRVRGTLAPIDVKTGGLSPEFGGETGAVLNLRTRFVTAEPLVEAVLTDGGYNTGQAFVTFGAKRSPKDARPNAAFEFNRGFSYLIHAGARYTSNAVEPPQPNSQTAGGTNTGRESIVFGKFDLGLNDTTNVSAILDSVSGRTRIANRTGLDSSYARYRAGGAQPFPGTGQGYGFAGLQDADQNDTSGTPLASQRAAGQLQYQVENHNIAAIQYRTKSTPLYRSGVFAGYRSEALFQIGGGSSETELRDRSPQGDVRNLEADNSIDYKPQTKQSYDSLSVQADLLLRANDHTFKFGGQYDDLSGAERYQFRPGSQRALDALYAFQTRYNLPTLVPPGTPTSAGYQVTQAPNVGAPVPTLRVTTSSSYGALYVQDTWRFNSPLTINYGFRYDFYRQSANSRSSLDGTSSNAGSVSENEFSPRLNIAFVLPSRGPLGFLAKTPTVLRAAYNRTFQRPTTAQGSFYGGLARPEVADVYDISLERQIDLRQTVRLGVYTKDIDNYLDTTGVLFAPFAGPALQPGFQFSTGAARWFNYPKANAYGYEVSYQYIPGDRLKKDGTVRVLPNGRVDRDPIAAYLVLSGNTVKPRFTGPFDSLGRFQPVNVDHDQQTTVDTGFSYTLADGTSAGLSLYYGSGLFSSIIPGRAGRDSVLEVNLRASTRPTFFRNAFGLEFAVENVLNGKGRYAFGDPYSGTRFQQGRRVMVSVFGRY
jgi:outer membrane receptor protein involved in Fe transport/F0F1-type ATP synthase membrane subunit c/vacuolar-type H+-ATPase subunit K